MNDIFEIQNVLFCVINSIIFHFSHLFLRKLLIIVLLTLCRVRKGKLFWDLISLSNFKSWPKLDSFAKSLIETDNLPQKQDSALNIFCYLFCPNCKYFPGS